MDAVKCLLNVIVYEFTGDEIGKLKEKYINKNRFYEEVLPPYCLNSGGSIERSADWFQWIDRGEDKYILFDAQTTDRLLADEISNGGLEQIFDDIKLKSIFESFQKCGFEDFNRSTLLSQYLVIELRYLTHFNGEYTDYSMESSLLGFLDYNLKLIPIDGE